MSKVYEYYQDLMDSSSNNRYGHYESVATPVNAMSVALHFKDTEGHMIIKVTPEGEREIKVLETPYSDDQVIADLKVYINKTIPESINGELAPEDIELTSLTGHETEPEELAQIMEAIDCAGYWLGGSSRGLHNAIATRS